MPPSLSNRRLHWAARHRVIADWKLLSRLAAGSVLRSKGGEKPIEASHRKVKITLYRVRMLDTDNAYASVKGVLDGLKGILVWDDDQKHCTLTVFQMPVRSKADQRTIVDVSL